MAISPDLVSGTTGTALERPTQSTQKISDIRRGNWLLSLEREQISQTHYQSPDMNPSNGTRLDQSNSGARNSLAVPSNSEATPAQTSLSWQKQVLVSANVVQSMPVAIVAEYPAQIGARSGISGLVADVDLNHAYTRPPLKDVPSLKLNEPISLSADSAVELEIMMPNTADVAAGGTNDNVAEAYSLRQIHLYSHEGKVQAWIRDAQLDEKRAVAVEAALRDDLKKSGWDLVGLAINGKKTASLLQKSQQRFQSHSVINA